MGCRFRVGRGVRDLGGEIRGEKLSYEVFFLSVLSFDE